MKVIQINNFYPNGSTGKIVHDLHFLYSKQGVESIVIAGTIKGKHKNSYCVTSKFFKLVDAIRSRITGLMYGGCFFSTNKIIGIIKREKPDIVHLHCVNGHTCNIYKLLTWLKKNNMNTVITLHAEFIFTGNCGHALDCQKYLTGCGKCPRLKKETKSFFFDRTADSWRKMNMAFMGFKNLEVVSVSPWLMERAKNSTILKQFHHSWIGNGVDTGIFYYRGNYSNNQEKKIVLYVTPRFNNDPNNIKGGCYLIELAKRMINYNVEFVVAGPYDNNDEYPPNVKTLGNVNDQNELALLYSKADVTLLTSKKETFSMVVAESLCCGTPIVGFKAGAPELISINDYSFFVEHGDVDALEDALKEILGRNVSKERISRKAIEMYSREKMASQYLKLYADFYKGFSSKQSDIKDEKN